MPAAPLTRRRAARPRSPTARSTPSCVAITDMQGRLQGKRLDARYFLDDVLEHGTEGCNYLLAVDVEMNTVDGYAISSWERGYGDFVMAPDLAHPAPRAVAAGHRAAARRRRTGSTATPVVESPRQILQRQLDRLAERGWTAFVGTELEFILFDDTLRAGLGRSATAT